MKNIYETDRYLNEYLLFHYGSPEQICPFSARPPGIDFHHDIVDYALGTGRKPGLSALDVGCGVGRLSFELSQKADFVLAIDRSANFIRAAQRIQKKGRHPVLIHEEGSRYTRDVVRLPKKFKGADIWFQQGDALKLPSAKFDFVFGINLIDRLPDPKRFLRSLRKAVVPGGLLVLGSPYTWMEKFTPRTRWLGDKNQSTSESLVKLLKKDFRLLKRKNFPFLIREHRRKYQWGVSEILVLARR